MKKIVLAFLFLFVGIVANAQEDFSDDTIDVPAAAIDNYVHWVFILSIIIIFCLFFRRKKKLV
jgi:uncharacterized protein HemY